MKAHVDLESNRIIEFSQGNKNILVKGITAPRVSHTFMYMTFQRQMAIKKLFF